MPDPDALRDKLCEDVETLLRDYCVAKSDLQMPVIEDWALVATFNDMADTEAGKWVYTRGKNQSTHRTVGLLLMCADDLRGITVDDD